MTKLTLTKPAAWIGCLAAYNSGHLHGRWVDLTLGVEAFDDACADILRSSPVHDAEELDVMDYEGIGTEIGLCEARRLAEWCDDVPAGQEAETLQRALAAFSWSMRDVLEAGPHAAELNDVRGPFQYRFMAEDESEGMAWDRLIDCPGVEAVIEMEYVSVDFKAAARNWYDISGSDGSGWFVVDSSR